MNATISGHQSVHYSAVRCRAAILQAASHLTLPELAATLRKQAKEFEAYLWLWSRLVLAVVVAGPHCKLTLVPLHVLRDPNVACLEDISCQYLELFEEAFSYFGWINLDYLPAFSFCRDTWPSRCCPWPLWRRPGRAQTGTFDAPGTDVSTFSGPTHGRYPKIENFTLWGLKHIWLTTNYWDPPEGWHRQAGHWWDHNRQGGRDGEHHLPSEAPRGTRPTPPWSRQPALGHLKFKIILHLYTDQHFLNIKTNLIAKENI